MYIYIHIGQQICAIYHYNCAKNDKGLKIATKEVDTIWTKYMVGGISKDQMFWIYSKTAILCIGI